MDQRRWRELSRLYDLARGLNAAERKAFLARACGADHDLRQEVESLLEQPGSEGVLETVAATGRLLPTEPADRAGVSSAKPSAPSSLIGRRIGSYHLIALIGAGGMGHVFRARDTRLGREVAVKVLPRTSLAEPERRARFEREARVLAALNHPNIATIHGIEDADGMPAIVMELVDGETLAARIARGLSLAEAVTIARQVAEALDAAHERGIVHRDLKPANILTTTTGVVKVLDFGLARVLERPDSGGGHDAASGQAPTMTRDRTFEGTVMGTPAYMSPEQARGEAVDKRTDIWAFGCVLYEMLSGRAAFARASISETLAAILEGMPDWSALPASTPPHIRRLLVRCLHKDLKRRARDIGDVRAELDAEGIAAVVPHALGSTRATYVALALAVGLAATLMGLAWVSLRPDPVRHWPVQFTFGAPDAAQFESAPVPSPDGTQIAFVARAASGERSVWIREVSSTAMRRLRDTDAAQGSPFWSPDGRWVGFFAQGRLKKIAVAGGPALTICPIENLLGATWNRDNVIVFAPVNRTVLHKVSAGGGTPEPITTLNPGRHENSHRNPHFLPDGRQFLFTARSDVIENNLIYVGSLDAPSITPLLPAQSNAKYAAGHLLFAREGTLMAQPFDVDRLRLSGEPIAVASRIVHATAGSAAAFDVSSDGKVLAYRPDVRSGGILTWFDRSGAKISEVGDSNDFQHVTLSPDGHSAAVVIAAPDSGNRDIWLVDLRSGATTRFTSNPANDWQMVWSPDSRRLAFASDRNGRSSVYVKSIDGGEEELLLRLPDRGAFPKDWSKDGHLLALNIDSPRGIPGLAAMRLTGDRTPFAVGSGSAVRENELMLTKNAKAMAFVSRQSGADEVYVAPFPKGGRRQVSVGGGVVPRWKDDDSELYYISSNGSIMRVSVAWAEAIAPSAPVTLFRPCAAGLPANATNYLYDVTSDGSRFLVICQSASSIPDTMTVAIDWTVGLN